MERFIGLDVHAASTTVAVIGPKGKRLSSHVVETHGQALVEQLKAIPGSKHVCLEEGTQSAWLYEILSPHATEVVVAMAQESRGQKDDERDAFTLAERLRTGAIERKVFKEVGEYKALRELARTHAMVVQDVVRVQNRIKALLRSRGVAVSGKTVYTKTGREEPLERLPEASRGAARTLFAVAGHHDPQVSDAIPLAGEIASGPGRHRRGRGGRPLFSSRSLSRHESASISSMWQC